MKQIYIIIFYQQINKIIIRLTICIEIRINVCRLVYMSKKVLIDEMVVLSFF